MTWRRPNGVGRLRRQLPTQTASKMNLESSHEPVLGTVLVIALTGKQCKAAQQWILEEFARLEAIFSAFNPASDLCRWRTGQLETTTDDELGALLEVALKWQTLTGGRFNPLAGELSDLWNAAERAQLLLDHHVTLAAAKAAAQPRYRGDSRGVYRTGDCSALTLNAIAKGHIVDLVAAGACERFSLDSIALSSGGDLAHLGHGTQTIGIENPHRPYENEPPLCTISLSNRAVATSGSARRGYNINGQRFSHILSPTTGEPVSEVAQVSIIAPAAATADALAAALMVLVPHAGMKLVSSLPDIGCLIVAANGTLTSNQTWDSHRVAG